MTTSVGQDRLPISYTPGNLRGSPSSPEELIFCKSFTSASNGAGIHREKARPWPRQNWRHKNIESRRLIHTQKHVNVWRGTVMFLYIFVIYGGLPTPEGEIIICRCDFSTAFRGGKNKTLHFRCLHFSQKKGQDLAFFLHFLRVSVCPQKLLSGGPQKV